MLILQLPIDLNDPHLYTLLLLVSCISESSKFRFFHTNFRNCSQSVAEPVDRYESQNRQALPQDGQFLCGPF